MEKNNMKNHLFRIRVSFLMLLFAVCLTMNVFLCSAYNFYELSDKTTVNEPWSVSEHNPYNETITRNICAAPLTAEIPKGIRLLPFLIIAFLFYVLTSSILLPDGWTLINQKVRLDN